MGISFWRCFFEECQIRNVFRGYFFEGGGKGDPFRGYFFDEEVKRNVFRGYFFEGRAKGNHFPGHFLEGEGKVVCFLNGLITEQFTNNENGEEDKCRQTIGQGGRDL